MSDMALDPATFPTGVRRGPGLLHGERLAAYQAAVRHSRLVRSLRALIPIGAAAAVAGLIGWSMLSSAARLPNVEMGPVSLTSSRLTMENPKLDGFRKDGKPYEVTAASASQDVRKPGIFELERINARLGAVGDDAVRLRAARGVYDVKSDRLQLSGGIHVETEKGDRAELSAAAVNPKAGEMETREPVRITTARGATLTADTMRVSDNGKVIAFEGRVKTVLYPQNERQDAARPAAGAPAPSGDASGTTDTGLTND